MKPQFFHNLTVKTSSGRERYYFIGREGVQEIKYLPENDLFEIRTGVSVIYVKTNIWEGELR
ncbi:gp36 [Listeria phage P40]|uniref:gp36 n=1 Tax=Listeria phage P40 TaxID=560178 RepID=UPI00018198EA|nr:gp36 [Listeria phage P40]ACI00396.1 gp36 [Listeria phage P40]